MDQVESIDKRLSVQTFPYVSCCDAIEKALLLAWRHEGAASPRKGPCPPRCRTSV